MRIDPGAPGRSDFNRLRGAIEDLQREHNERVAQELAEAQIRMNGALFDKAAAYTNVITVVGYAGFFGLWQLAKEHLSRGAVLWSAFFMGVSILAFLSFEIYKVTTLQLSLARAQSRLPKPGDGATPEAVLAHLREIDRAARSAQARMIPIWTAAFVVCVVTGLAGAGILLWALVVGLLAP